MAAGRAGGAALRLALGLTARISESPQPALVESPPSGTITQRRGVPITHHQLIEQYVRNNLRSDPLVDYSNIHLMVRNGVVTSEGSVVCVEEVELAGKIARETGGAGKIVRHLCIHGYQ